MAHKTAREVMSGGAACIGENDTIVEAARKLADLNAVAMPICGEDQRLKGLLSGRDIIVEVLGKGKDPAQTTAGEVATREEVLTIGADDTVDEVLRTMVERKAWRLPVIDGHKLIGIVSRADLAKQSDDGRVNELAEAISATP